MTEVEVENYMNYSPSIQRRVPARELAATMDGQTDLPLDRLRDAEQAMTPGPWWGGTNNRRKNGIGLVSVGGNREAAPIAVLAGARQTIADRGANTAGIVSLRNHAAALIDAAESVQAVRALCDDYRANCDPRSVQAKVAEMFRALLPPAASQPPRQAP